MQYKNLSEALERVNNVYLSGTIEFYAKMNPDPWQEAHEELEAAIDMTPPGPGYFEALQTPINTFVSTLEGLVANYKPFSAKQKSHPAVLGLYSNSPEQAAERYSIQEKRCAECATKEKIRARKNPKTGSPMIMCDGCWEKGGKVQ